MNIAAFASYVLLSAFTPGPNNIMSMTNASKYGMKKAFPFNIGVFLGFLCVLSACAVFSSLLYDLIPSVKPFMLCVGAAYILWLAWTVWRDKPHAEAKGPFSQTNTVLAGAVLQFVNVKCILYGITAMSSFTNRGYHDMTHLYAWSGNTIAHIISKPEYMGHTVNFRTYKDSYKDKQTKHAAKEDWMIFENTHPAIVDTETWETAQRCRKTVRRTDSLGEANPLTGLVFCADCGAKMYNHRIPHRIPYTHPNNGKVYYRAPKDEYSCSTYSLTNRKFDKQCTQYYVRTVVLRELVLDAIKTVSSFVKTDEAEFIKQVREASNVQQEETAKAHKKRIAKEQKRVAELNTLIRKIYEDNVSGKLNDKRFEVLSAEYESEQEQLEKTIASLQAEIDLFNSDSVRADKFIEIVKRYTDFEELTPQMINEFVQKIIVHEADKSSGERCQQVDIYLNFIGKFDVKPKEPTPEEIAENEQQRIKRERHKESQRRYVERQKSKEMQEAI